MATNRTQAERGKFLNADTWDKLTSNIEKGFNEFRGNSDNKLIQILAKYQESKLGQAHTKAGKATSDILFKNPYEFGQQMTNDVSDIFGMNNPNYQMRNAPGTGWGNVGKQLGRTLSTGSFIAGTGNPLGAAVYTGISGGVGYLGNRVAGQSHKSAMSNVLPNMLESVPRGFQIAGISSITNPWIDKAGLAGKGYWGRNLIKSPLNVVQGLAMDQATGSKTTAQSVALDALFPFAQESLGSAVEKFKGNLDDYLEYRKTLSPEDLQKGFVNFGAEVGGSTIKKYKPSELKYLEADGGGIEDAVAGLPKGQTSVTKGPIEAVRTPDGLMVLDGRTRSVEAYKKGDVPIDVKILSKDEALKRWGSMFPEGLLDDIIGDGGEVKGGDLLEEARKYKSAEEFVKSKINSYHGTNTEFDKFNLENIGKGEGTDAFGNNTNILGDGIYLSDNKQIADVYAQSRVKKDFITGYKDTGILGTPEPVYKEGIDDLVKQNKKVIESYVGGELLDAKTYKVNDELKELISKEIQKDGLSKANADRLTNQAIDFYRNNTKNISGAETGEFMYVLDKTIGVNNKAGLNAVNKYLASKGYSGIKYPSDLKYEGVQGNNYFIFDTNKIKTSKELTDIWNQANKVGGDYMYHGTRADKEIVRDVNMDKAQEWLNRPNKTPTKELPRWYTELEEAKTLSRTPDDYVYHTTSLEKINSIAKSGLKPGTGMYGKGVYFAPTENLTKNFGLDDGAMIRIKRGNLPKGYDEFPEQGWVNEVVPPKYLEYKEKGSDVWKPLIKEEQGETGKYFTNVKKSSMSYPYKDYRKYSSEELTGLIKKYENVYYDTTAKLIRKKGTGEPILGRLPQKQIDSLISQGFIKIGKK